MGLLANAINHSKPAHEVTIDPLLAFLIISRDLQIENLKKEIDLLRAELEKIKLEVRSGV